MDIKFNKVCFLVENPWSEREHMRYGIEILQNNGFEVSVFDFSYAIYPLLKKNNHPIYQYCKLCNSKQDIIDCISNIPSDVLVACICAYRESNLFIYKLVSSCDLTYMLVLNNTGPFVFIEPSKRRFSDLMMKLKKLSLSDIWHKSVNLNVNYRRRQLLNRYRLKIKAPDYWVIGGSECLKDYSDVPRCQQTQIIWASSFDYDLYLKEFQNHEDKSDLKYLVFIDGYLPFHPDFYTCDGKESPVDASLYYPGLCKCFDIIEKKLGLPVVVAAHPHSDYEDNSSYFKGRRIIKGQTSKLIKSSKAVIMTHASTSASFAVMFSKPVIFLKTDALNHEIINPMFSMSEAMDAPIIDQNELMEIDLTEKLYINQAKYEEYQAKYIKVKDSPVQYCWQIVADHLLGKNIN